MRERVFAQRQFENVSGDAKIQNDLENFFADTEEDPFLPKLQSEGGKDRFEYLGGLYVYHRMNKHCFANQILVPELVDPQDPVPLATTVGMPEGAEAMGPKIDLKDGVMEDPANVETDYYAIIRRIPPPYDPDRTPPLVRAGIKTGLPMNFRGMPTARYNKGYNYIVPLGTWTSEPEQNGIQEMSAGSFNMIEQLDRHGWEVGQQRDQLFKSYVDAAVKTSGKHIKRSGHLVNEHVKDLETLLIKDNLKPAAILCSDVLYNEQLQWNGSGPLAGASAGQPVSQVTRKVVRSPRSDMFDTYSDDGTLKSTTVYMFAAQDELGDGFHWGQRGEVKIWSRWEMNLFTFAAFCDGGYGIKNIRAIAKLTLKRG